METKEKEGREIGKNGEKESKVIYLAFFFVSNPFFGFLLLLNLITPLFLLCCF